MATRKTALITGITGQDGSYLAEFLLSKDYMVHGIKRRSSLLNTQRIDHLYHDLHEKDVRFKLHYGDLTDSSNLIRIIQEVQPDEIYNLGAMSARESKLRYARVCRRHRWPWNPSDPGSCSPSRPREKDKDLPGIYIRIIRTGAGDPTTRNNTILSPFALCRCKALRLLDHSKLPRSLQHVCMQRNFIQPRVASSR